jgi:hypothetical protein
VKELTRRCKRNNRCQFSFSEIIETSRPEIRKACDDESYLYVQAPCIVPTAKLLPRKILGLAISAVAVWIYLFVHVTVEYIKSVQQNMFVDWDVKTISAADYTVEFRVKPEMYEHFQE